MTKIKNPAKRLECVRLAAAFFLTSPLFADRGSLCLTSQ